MKKFLLKSLFLLCALVVGSNAWADDYALYSGTITEGDYVIVYSNGAMKNTISSDRLEIKDVTISSNKISNPAATIIWHIAASGDYWTIYNANINKYAASTGAKNKAQLLASGSDDKSLWTVSGSSTYEFVNKQNTTNKVNANLRQNGNYGFACYSTSIGGALSLYKKVPSHTLTYSATNGSISGVVYNTSTAVVSGASVAEGGKVTLTATPASGYAFSGWSVSGTGSTLTSTSTNPTTFTMGTANSTVTATFTVSLTCATPTFSVAGGTYYAAQSVELGCTTDEATIHYTTDGTDPTTSSPTYSGAISVSTTTTIKAIAVKDGLTNSSIASATYTLKCATPTITVPEGPFFDTKVVTMASTSDGVSIYYTTDGTDPTSGSTAYDPSNKPSIDATTTFKAIAIKDGWENSEVAEETFTKQTVKTVAEALEAIDALDDNGTIASQYVKGIVSTAGSLSSGKITYFISDDGTTTNQLQVYSGKGLNDAYFTNTNDIQVGDKVTVFGTLKKYVKNSSTTPEFDAGNYLYSIVKKPTFSPVAGAVVAGTAVTISSTLDGATIYYTTNGSTPTTGSSVYSAPIVVNAAMTIKAIAVKEGYPESSVAEATYTIAVPCATPTFSPAAGAYSEAKSVTISCTTEGATIYYTTDGTEPTTLSTVYSSAISVNTDKTLKAIAVKDGYVDSEVGEATYTFYAALPFAWDDKTTPVGVTNSGVGTYNASPYLKFDDANDFIILKINKAPGTLTFDIKGNSFSGGTFKVQASSDGTNYSDIKTYTSLGSSTSHESISTLETTVRYIKWIYTTKDNGNVALGKISLNLPVSEPSTPVDNGDNTVTLTTTANMAGWRTFAPIKDNQNYTVDGTTKVYYASATAGGKVTLTEIAGGVPANTAVILHQTSGTDITLTETDATITAPASNLLLVSTAGQNLGTVYRLGYKSTHGVGFYTYTTNSAPAGIIYLASINAAHELLGLDFDGETTAINNLTPSLSKGEGEYYDLQGRKVAQPTKGLYIVNGRKVIVK
jgi:hypothetical protein